VTYLREHKTGLRVLATLMVIASLISRGPEVTVEHSGVYWPQYNTFEETNTHIMVLFVRREKVKWFVWPRPEADATLVSERELFLGIQAELNEESLEGYYKSMLAANLENDMLLQVAYVENVTPQSVFEDQGVREGSYLIAAGGRAPDKETLERHADYLAEHRDTQLSLRFIPEVKTLLRDDEIKVVRYTAGDQEPLTELTLLQPYHKGHPALEGSAEIKIAEGMNGGSQGLVLTLVAIEELHQKRIAPEYVIAATGSINEHGIVETVGGYGPKARAAVTQKADVLFVPKDAKEVVKEALEGVEHNMEIVEVRHVRDVLNWLCDNEQQNSCEILQRTW